jgi:hypothetical protein
VTHETPRPARRSISRLDPEKPSISSRTGHREHPVDVDLLVGAVRVALHPRQAGPGAVPPGVRPVQDGDLPLLDERRGGEQRRLVVHEEAAVLAAGAQAREVAPGGRDDAASFVPVDEHRQAEAAVDPGQARAARRRARR